MTENMKKLLEKVSSDKALAEKFNKLDQEGIIAAAKELGLELTEADFVQPEEAMAEQELAAVAGGGICFCWIAGGGTRKEDKDPCGCVFYGNGEDQSTFCALIGVDPGSF